MAYRMILGLALAASVGACATGPTVFPVQVARFHYDPVASRGTVAIEPLPGGPGDGIEYQAYAAAVQAELYRLGYVAAVPGKKPDNLATVAFSRTPGGLPPRRSPVTIGIGGGGFSGGRGGGVGLGGGVNFPVGGRGASEGVVTELQVRIRRGADAVWEGNARVLADPRGSGADTAVVSQRLAAALFAGFPGESGRTIEVP